jgi:hypothetical protein
MKLTLKRNIYTTHSTIGELYLDNEFICYTLEDVVRADGVKIYGETAIPDGKYSVCLSYSNRFKRVMPLLYNHPDLSVRGDGDVIFRGIRIHSGNTDEDTLGCILVGETKTGDFVGHSRRAYRVLMTYLKDIDIIDLEIINIV